MILAFAGEKIRFRIEIVTDVQESRSPPVINRPETERELPSNHDLTLYSRRTAAGETALGKQTGKERGSEGKTSFEWEDRQIDFVNRPEMNENRRFRF